MATKRREIQGLTNVDALAMIDAAAAAMEAGGQLPSTCLSKADLDEPLFILRGQDRCAPAAVRDWAHRAKGAGCSVEKVAEAMDIAAEMEEWQERTGRAKWPD